MNVTIRPLAPEDRAEWAGLWEGYLAYYETVLPPEQYDLTFARLMAADLHEYHGLLAVAGDRPVGLAHYLFHRHGWKEAQVCYLQDLFVDPATRGTGAGRALIEAVYAAADEAGAAEVYWTTQDFNVTARRLYDRIGKLTPFVKYVRA